MRCADGSSMMSIRKGSSLLSLVFLSILFITGCSFKPLPPDYLKPSSLNENEGLLVFTPVARLITVEYDGFNKKIISVEKLDTCYKEIEHLGSICPNQANGLKVVRVESGNHVINHASPNYDQGLRFNDISLPIAPKKVNYIGKVNFDIVLTIRKYPDQTRRWHYHRIVFSNNYEEASALLTSMYENDSVEVINQSIISKPILFEATKRHQRRNQNGWIEAIDSLIPE